MLIFFFYFLNFAGFSFDTLRCGMTLLRSVTSVNLLVLICIEDFLVWAHYLSVCFFSDLALRNCFLTSDLNVKVGDYGIGFSRYKVS